MALDSWLIKVKTALSNGFESVRSVPPNNSNNGKPLIKKTNVGVLAFEIAGLMSKLIHLWKSLSDKNILLLKTQAISLEGVRKIVSNDDSFLLTLACAEMVDNLSLLSRSASRFSSRCVDPSLRNFHDLLNQFADTGFDTHNWLLSGKEFDSILKKIDRLISSTANLHKQIDTLTTLETGLKKMFKDQNEITVKQQRIIDLKQRIIWQRQEIKILKDKSLWNRTYDSVNSLIVRFIFTILARIKHVFGVVHHGRLIPVSLSRTLSASATVYPSENQETCNFVSGPLNMDDDNKYLDHDDGDGDGDHRPGFFEMNSKTMIPPSGTLGAAALSHHYANLIIVMEKMIKSPQLVGMDARDDLYYMLPSSIRSALRIRLKGVGFSASDPGLAGEWRDALGKILGWVSPLAHNMIKWQSERSFEQQQHLIPKTNFLLFQTLFFANKVKTEAAITELLVGLNYIWRFEREMINAKAFIQGANFNGFSNPNTTISNQ
ncbi:protein PSK SIMULATOR 1-like [Impatiens glandulifera]|uniref:protein PSK SIMULATOR 1-like n=1 Tax=Impatiens glandulifera TaxID=253017 RepID=UPI001FB16C3E|nr:protein PSK SIMULATOR 1-like [Impatiens glandulifera]